LRGNIRKTQSIQKTRSSKSFYDEAKTVREMGQLQSRRPAIY
jgi:hypothetical protein